jgi:hypothetical protein
MMQPRPPKSESLKCTVIVRAMLLESFRLSRDGRKWKQAARSRYDFLVWLSTWSNGDGSFIGATGIDYSPSEKTIATHVASSSYYELSDALQKLGLLSWTRPQTHYGRRSFTIHLSKTPPTFANNTSNIQTKTPPTFIETPPATGGDNTSSHWNNPSSPNTAPENAENPRTNSTAATSTNARAPFETGAAAEAALSSVVAVFADSSKRSEHPPSNPTTGGQEGTPSGESRRESQRQALVEFSVATVTEDTAQQVQQESQRERAIANAAAYRELPQEVRDQVKRLSQRCREDWNYWRVHDRAGDAIEITEESDYRLPEFEVPKAVHQLQLAELLKTYTESQILGAWKTFINRSDGFDGLYYIWANFVRECEYYIAVKQPVAGGVS